MPNIQQPIDIKPENQSVSGQVQAYTETRVIGAGMLIPWAGFTYPTAGTFTATRI